MRSKSQRLIDYHSLAVAAHYKVPVRHRQRSKHWLLFRWTLTGNTHAWKNARIQDAYRYYVIITAMASKNPALTRGTACRQCRKRKMRCDGLRPSCTPCRKTHRQDDCEYDDRKSRTQMLQEKITLLESRIQELERQPSGSISPGPSSLRGSSMHTDFHKSSDSSSPPTEEGAPVVEFQDFSAMEWEPSPFLDVPEIPPSDTPFYMAGLQYEHRTPASALHSLAEETPQDLGPDPHVWNFGGTNIDASTSTAERGESGSTPASWSADCDLPSASKEILLDTFLSHRQQCYFEFVGNTNRHTLTALVSPHQQPHPALKHAIFLLACHFARSPWFSGVEPKLFDKTLREINDALQHSDRLLDVVQASCLVAVYLFIKSRPLEGYYHSYSAARLAVGLGFSHHTQNADILSTNFEKKPELKDHALVSRQVFMIDRLWTIAYGLPPAFPGDLSPWINEVADSDPEQPQMAELSPAMRTKATSLLDRSCRLARTTTTPGQFLHEHEHREISSSLENLSAATPPLRDQIPKPRAPSVKAGLFTIHTMISTAQICLHVNVMRSSLVACEQVLRAGLAVIGLIRELSEEDWDFLDPIMSTCWTLASNALISIRRRASHHPLEATRDVSVAAVDKDLGVLVDAMERLSKTFPCAGANAKMIKLEMAVPDGSQ